MPHELIAGGFVYVLPSCITSLFTAIMVFEQYIVFYKPTAVLVCLAVPVASNRKGGAAWATMWRS